MTDQAYDITHLLESELATSNPPELRIVRTPPPRPTPTAGPVVRDVKAAQEDLARELMQSADVHEALIEQYLRISRAPFQDAFAQ